MKRTTGIRNIYNATNLSFTWSSTDEYIALFTAVPELLHILDGIQARTPVGNVGIKVILLALLINGDTLKDEILRVPWLHWTRLEYGVDHPILADPSFDEINVEIQIP